MGSRMQVFRESLKMKNTLLRNLGVEVVATFVVSVLTHGVLAQDFMSRAGSTFNIAVTISLAITLCIYVGFGTSGGHLNLTLSVGLAAAGVSPWRRIPSYFLAQLIGGFLGAVAVYYIYEEAFDVVDGGIREAFGENGTAAIFATFPRPYVSMTTGFFELVLISGILLFVVGALIDQRNIVPSFNLSPVFFGLTVFTILMGFTYNAGGSLNPSVDLSGRAFLSVMGYGSEVWTPGGVHWWWIPLIAPALGSALGSWAYIVIIKMHHEDIEDSIDEKCEKELAYEVNNVVEMDNQL